MSNCKRQPLGIKWPSKPIKALGVYFSYDEKRFDEENFEAKLQSLKAKLDIWKSRDLSIYGRILQIKSLGISQFFISGLGYFCVSRIEQLIFNFLWKGRGDKVKRTAAINFSRDGGLEMIDIRSMIKSLRCKWILRYLNKKESTWNSIINHYFKPSGSVLLCWCNYKTSLLSTKMPTFYEEVLTSWRQYIENSQPDSSFAIHSQIIWTNKNILINRTSFYAREFHNAGPLAVKDLFDNSGNVQPFEFWSLAGIKHEKYFWMSFVDSIPKQWSQTLRSDKYSQSVDIRTLVNVKKLHFKSI